MSKIFISCSASNDIDLKYIEESSKIFNKLKDHELLFGGFDSGLMGLAYHTFGNSVGIAPKINKEGLESLNCEKVILNNSGESTAKLILDSDIILVLPGGIGTLMELFTALHMKRIGEMDKPIIIYNLGGFYNDTISLIEDLIFSKFISKEIHELLNIFLNEEDVVKFINNYKVKEF